MRNHTETGASRVALVGVLVPLGMGTLLGFLFAPGESDPSLILQHVFIGTILTATSVSITVETLKEIGKLNTKVGNNILAAALIDDVLGLIVLTIVTSLAGDTVNVGLVLVKILLFFVFVAAMAFVGVKLFTWYENRFQKNLHRFPLLAFVLCLVMAFVAEEVMEEAQMPDFVIVTGMSGAGRTEAMHVFEDLGYYCVDNLPSSLLAELVRVNESTEHEGGRRRLAVVCDSRNGDFFGDLEAELSSMREAGVSYKTLFLDAADDKLIARYKSSRRRHPLCTDGTTIWQGIQRERLMLMGLRDRADYVIDMGPGAGEHGGEVIYSGPAKRLIEAPRSVTGDYIAGRRSIEVPAVRRKPHATKRLRVVGARENNLKNITVDFPLGVMTVVTGVSGSGKSTLVNTILYPVLADKLNGARIVPGKHTRVEGLDQCDKVIHVDQNPIGRTPRSNPATYTGVWDKIRTLFAKTPEAQVRGYGPGRFSFNVKGGRCEACHGDGTLKIEMNFLPDVYVECEECHGKRYNRETLEVKYNGKTVADVLDMPIEEAATFFKAYPSISRYLDTLVQVGLGYIRLGQPAPMLSGGESQRVKLATELQRRSTGKTVYILDEPTTGLHFEDVRKLLLVLQGLVDKGNTVIVIEHNLDVVKSADWIIDLGPEGGDGGGTIVTQGTPEQVAQCEASWTGKFLKDML